MKMHGFLVVFFGIVGMASAHGHHHTKVVETIGLSMEGNLYAILASAFLSVLSCIGILVLDSRNEKLFGFITASAVGIMISDVFLHMAPELYHHGGKDVSIVIVVGFFICFLVDLYFDSIDVPLKNGMNGSAGVNLINDAIHNFYDGIGLVGAFSVSNQVGMATTVAMIFHEIPQEIVDMTVLLNTGLSKYRALFYNFLCGLTSIIGCFMAIYLNNTLNISKKYLLAWSIGSFLYISCVDMMPRLKKQVF